MPEVTWADPALLPQLQAAYTSTPIPTLRLDGFLSLAEVSQVMVPDLELEDRPDLYLRHAVELEDFPYADPVAFKAWLEEVTRTRLGDSIWRLEVYGAGDYTLLNAEADLGPRLKVTLDLTLPWNPDQGGFDLIHQGEGDPLIGARTPGTLSLIRLDPPVLSCVRYVNHTARDRTVRLLVGIYPIQVE